MPTNWQLYIFKKQGSYVTDQEITDFFAGTLTDAQLAERGIFVFRNLPAQVGFKRVDDFRVWNDLEYFYRALIRDKTLNENSTTKNGSATPAVNILINVVDAKDLVARVCEKLLDTLKSVQGTKVAPEKDIRIFKSHARRKEEVAFIVIQRSPGQNVETYLSNIMAEYGSEVVKGQVDIDTIQIEWICIGDPERRDRLTNIFRVMRPVFYRFLMKMGNGRVRDVRFIMGGDSEGQYQGAEGVRGIMTVAVVIEQELQVQNPNLGVLQTIINTYVEA